MKKRSMGDRIFDAIVYAILVVVFLIVFFPLMYVVSTSFASARELALNKFLIFPKHPTLEVYQYIFSTSTFLRSMIVTIVITVVGTLVNLVMTCLMAYPLSRKALPGRSVIMTAVTFTLVFSGGMIPMYLTVQQLHIYNTTWAMVLPVAVSAYNLIVCRSFFESGIPVELLEAAKIDGCSDFGFFFKIAIPLSKTIIAVMCLFYATAMWNQFFNALMFLQDDSKMPLQVVLRNLVLMNQSNQMGSSASEMVTKQKLAEQLKYCVVVVSAFPLLCVYPFLQKYFAKGVTIGAVKG